MLEACRNRPALGLLSQLLLLALTAGIGCSPAARQRTASALSAAGAGAAGATAPVQQKLMIFGGHDHRTYLGCLNCSEYATDSVFNQYGTNGSPYSATSIWNPYGDFGSPYSNEGACNPYANDPPVIVDLDGRYYGRLTLNQYHLQIGIGKNYSEWLMSSVCKQ
jgi:hypothetical protein